MKKKGIDESDLFGSRRENEKNMACYKGIPGAEGGDPRDENQVWLTLSAKEKVTEKGCVEVSKHKKKKKKKNHKKKKKNPPQGGNRYPSDNGELWRKRKKKRMERKV